MRNILTAGLLLAGVTAAQAQTITPGIGGVAITGQSGAGVVIPYGGGNLTFGAPGVGTYQSGGVGYTSPYSLNQFSNPNAYNFNTGSFNYNTGVYNSGWNNGFNATGWNNGFNTTGWNNGLSTSSYYGSPYSNGNVILNSGYNTYPYNGSSFNNNFGGRVNTPVIYTNTNGRGRGRIRFR